MELKPQIALEVALQVKAYFEANLSVIANFIYAKLEANLFVRLQASVEVWLQNNINLFVALIYAKLEANLYLRLEPNIKIYIDNNPKFRGPDGAKGEKGDKGDRGERGLQGLPGQDGAKGEKGDRGDRGERGERGLPGLKGDKGEKGDNGDRGERGLPGKDGLTDLTFTPRLFWNPNNNRLELRLTINGTTKTTTVTIPMECDFSELIEYLQDIQDKVTITPDIQAGECGDPSEPGDWYQYIPGTAVPAGGLEEAFTLLSNQIKELHETACQGVQPKVPVRDLPQVIECVKDEETGDVQVQAMSLGDMETNLGFVPPWAIGVAKDVIAPWAIDQALNWLGNWLTEQTKINQEIICKIEAGGDCSVLLPDPSAVWNTKGSYLLFYWYLEGQPNWKHTTQLAEPIDAITNPGDPASVWATYFAGLEIKIGNQWAQIYTADKRRRSPLYRGWFWDKQEAEDKLYQIAALSKIPIREFNNPKFTEVKNQTVHLTNQGKIMKLRKVCVAVKTEDSDQITIVRGYERPQEN
ncbi:collagen-like protein [Synechocystis sp. CS-94]|uniref:collagen-like protein n=1 Tax=Synechocystis sp. CS-94 TaxID=2847986 RepID=UPI00223BEFB4|nr:collagen-like protein [Synechocystis sp. CS-94]MCT0253539.1 collagen-like protein [Synechocystis sp. CS-94]